MVLKVKSDPNCPGVKEGPPADANLNAWGLKHDATTNNPRLRFSMASIRKERWEEIFGRKSRNNAKA
jgi:hypothetical protein